MVSAAARERVSAAIARAEREGAEALLDGCGDAGPAGTVVASTIAIAPGPESELDREELFGPLLALVDAPDLDATLEFVNGSR